MRYKLEGWKDIKNNKLDKLLNHRNATEWFNSHE